MKKLLVTGCLLAFGGFLTGCATIEKLPGDKTCPAVDGRQVVEYVDVQNTCWKLLCFIPLFSGDVDDPNRCTTSLFDNTLGLDTQMRMLDAEVRRSGATQAIDVTSREDDSFAIFFLVKRYCYHTSATLVK